MAGRPADAAARRLRAGSLAKYVYRDVPSRGWRRLAAHGLTQAGYAVGIAMAADGSASSGSTAARST